MTQVELLVILTQWILDYPGHIVLWMSADTESSPVPLVSVNVAIDHFRRARFFANDGKVIGAERRGELVPFDTREDVDAILRSIV